LRRKRFVVFHLGDRRADHVKDEPLNLSAGIRETVKGVGGAFGNDAVLHSDSDNDRDIVFASRLAKHIELLNAETQASRNLFEGPAFEAVETRI
jgi:hypothetical protein